MEKQFEKSSNLMVLLLTNYGIDVLGAISPTDRRFPARRLVVTPS